MYSARVSNYPDAKIVMYLSMFYTTVGMNFLFSLHTRTICIADIQLSNSCLLLIR